MATAEEIRQKYLRIAVHAAVSEMAEELGEFVEVLQFADTEDVMAMEALFHRLLRSLQSELVKRKELPLPLSPSTT